MGRTATASFLFVDLVESTRILHELGDDRNDEFQRRYLAALRGAVTRHGGAEVKCLGDGLMAVFPGSVAGSIRAAVDMQHAIHRLGHTEFVVGPKLRVGISVGEATEGDTDWSGTPVVEAARLEAAAAPNTILVNDLVRVLIGSRGGFTFTPAGDLDLKGFPTPLTCATVEWQDMSLSEDVLADDRSALPAGSDVPIPPALSMFRLGEFAGRQHELTTLESAWDEARRAGPLMLTLEGEPGIGKTRLVAEFAEAVHARGATVMAGRCTPEPIWPFEPFADAVRGYLASLDEDRRPGCSSALPPSLLSLIHPGQEDSAAQRRRSGTPVDNGPEVIDAVSLVLDDLCQQAPLLLVLDDLHWAAPDTFAVLRHLVRPSGATPLLVIGTMRDTEVGQTHPLATTLSQLDRQRSLHRVSVGGLSEPDIAALVHRRPEIDQADAVVRLLRERTDGNPFFLEQILDQLESPSEGDALPRGVRESVAQRVSVLDEGVEPGFAGCRSPGCVVPVERPGSDAGKRRRRR